MNMVTIPTSESIAEFQKFLTVRAMSPHTVKAYSADLRMLQNWLTEEEITPELDFETTAAEWLNATRDEAKPRTTQRRLATLKSYARWSGNPFFLHQYRAPTAARAKPHPIAEGKAGVIRMCEAAPTKSASALIALQGLMGMRISEARSLDLQSLNVDQMTLLVRGKGDKDRDLPIPAEAWQYILPAYQYAREFGGEIVKYSDRGARVVVTSTAAKLDFERPVSSHDLRATFATDLLRRTGNIRLVQEWLGHANIKNTEIYTQVTMNDLRAGVETIG